MLNTPSFSPRNLSRNEPSDASLTPEQCSKIIHISQPNREIPHPKSKELFPIVYCLINNSFEEFSIQFIENNDTNVFYEKFHNSFSLKELKHCRQIGSYLSVSPKSTCFSPATKRCDT